MIYSQLMKKSSEDDILFRGFCYSNYGLVFSYEGFAFLAVVSFIYTQLEKLNLMPRETSLRGAFKDVRKQCREKTKSYEGSKETLKHILQVEET